MKFTVITLASREACVNGGMTGDPPTPQPRRLPSIGFVVAMRARVSRLHKPVHYEWIIVSRWGQEGGFLSFSWTGVDADSAQAPIQLLPRRTVIGLLDPKPRTRAGVLFRLISELPETLPVAGQFMPSSGTVRLLGTETRLRLRSRGREIAAPPAPAWDITAERGPWIGEFVEEPPA